MPPTFWCETRLARDQAQRIGTGRHGAGPVANWHFGGRTAPSSGSAPGSSGSSCQSDSTPATSDTSRLLDLGFHDTGAGPDNNHDDLIIIPVSIVPEPDTRAMLIAGFGLVGSSQRRRRVSVRVTG